MSKPSAKAVVVATIEIPLSDVWGDDCTVGQVNDQASRSVQSLIARLQCRDAVPPSHLPVGTTIRNVKVHKTITT